VTGVDIFPMRLSDQPENLDLYGYNLNDRLNHPDVFQSGAYDLIYSRFVAPGLKANRWSSYFRDIRVLLRPGGWVQVTEYLLNIRSDNGSITVQSAVYRWWQAYDSAMQLLNRDARIGPKLQGKLAAAGLRNVQVDDRRLPIGAWDPGA
jgi:hypothetical protein